MSVRRRAWNNETSAEKTSGEDGANRARVEQREDLATTSHEALLKTARSLFMATPSASRAVTR
ncbi:MAG: hypothetical protein M5U15_06560 [Kiritimatiellae bacterium]|nr:hypothetical protein [Kiritimatiellia bacterium]